jgi:excisionase family DNA binding protein
MPPDERSVIPMSSAANEADGIPASAALLTADQVAALLQLDRRTVERKTAAGQIPGACKVGHARHYVRADVEQWIAGGGPQVRGGRRAAR